MSWSLTGSRWLLLAIAAGLLSSCMTRSGFEGDSAALRCAIHGVCERRKCDALRASAEPNDRELYELTCPAEEADCGPPDYGDWRSSDPPDSDCFTFDADTARQCLVELQAVLRSSETAPLTDDIWCWRGAPTCSEVYGEIDWPECSLEE